MDRYLRAALDAVDRTVGGLDPDVIARPMPGRWSIAEILEHLTLAFTVNAAALEKALASGQLRARKPSLTARLARIIVSDVAYFPRAEAPAGTRPSGSIPAEHSIAAIRDAMTGLDGTLARVTARFGDDVPVANHPYFSGLTAPQWRKFHMRHTEHHMRQIRRRRNAGQ
jgi:hypothetical protein